MPPSERKIAYTTVRSDVLELVPSGALYILDVGCSNGANGRALRTSRPERKISGIELDAAFATEATCHLDYVVNTDINSLDWNQAFGKQLFDCIIFADILEHLIAPQKCLENALQHLSPGGSIIVSLPNIRHISAMSAIFVAGQFPRRDRGIFDRTHLHWYTLQDACELLTRNGLKISGMNQALRWGDLGGGKLNKLLNRLPTSIKHWQPIREFLTYQVCLRAELAQ